MRPIMLSPVDTWFFRDSTPFSSDSSSQSEVGGLFPPHPPTVTGAVRAALARANGWTGQGRWDPGLNEVLGDGPAHLGQLRLTGPVVLREDIPLFPVPRHMVGARLNEDRWEPQAFLSPGPPVACDLGDSVRLPALQGAVDLSLALKPADGQWLTVTGLSQVLRGELPSKESLVAARELWHVERRVALERNPETRAAEEGMLFAPRHLRLAADVAVGVGVEGLPKTFRLPQDGELLSFGGEARLAEWRASGWRLELPAPRVAETVALIALTPLDLPHEVVCEGKTLALSGTDAAVEVVSACQERPQRIGGWSTLDREPLPQRGYLAPGSVLFCRVTRPPSAGWTGAVLRVGEGQAAGFGLVALSNWNDMEDRR